MFSIPQAPTPVSNPFGSSFAITAADNAIPDKPGRFIISQRSNIGGIDGIGFLAEPMIFVIESDIFLIQSIYLMTPLTLAILSLKPVTTTGPPAFPPVPVTVMAAVGIEDSTTAFSFISFISSSHIM